jgi:hypothetical protein
MTREQSIEASKGPGKFEGCPIYAPYFWAAVMNGEGTDETIGENEPDYKYEDVGSLVTHIDVESNDRAIFPELTSVDSVSLWEDDNGFIYLEV